jgi:hypothetical protein
MKSKVRMKTVQQDVPPPKKEGRRGPNWVVSLKRVLTEVSPPVLDLPYLSLHCFANILH